MHSRAVWIQFASSNCVAESEGRRLMLKFYLFLLCTMHAPALRVCVRGLIAWKRITLDENTLKDFHPKKNNITLSPFD